MNTNKIFDTAIKKSCDTLSSTFYRVNEYSKNPDSFPIEERFNDVKLLVSNANDQSFHGYFIVKGLENTANQQVLFTPNHTSIADSFSMILSCNRPIGFLTSNRGIDKSPFDSLIRALSSKNIIGDSKCFELDAYKRVNEVLNKFPSLSYVTYPEEEKEKLDTDFSLGKFNPLIFSLAVKNSLPIVPVAIYSSTRLLDKNCSGPNCPIYISYLKPLKVSIYDGMSYEDIAEYVKEKIVDELDRLIDIDYSTLNTSSIVHRI